LTRESNWNNFQRLSVDLSLKEYLTKQEFSVETMAVEQKMWRWESAWKTWGSWLETQGKIKSVLKLISGFSN
jgi:hypothetical protein